jgi:hypothetical protein
MLGRVKKSLSSTTHYASLQPLPLQGRAEQDIDRRPGTALLGSARDPDMVALDHQCRSGGTTYTVLGMMRWRSQANAPCIGVAGCNMRSSSLGKCAERCCTTKNWRPHWQAAKQQPEHFQAARGGAGHDDVSSVDIQN